VCDQVRGGFSKAIFHCQDLTRILPPVHDGKRQKVTKYTALLDVESNFIVYSCSCCSVLYSPGVYCTKYQIGRGYTEEARLLDPHSAVARVKKFSALLVKFELGSKSGIHK
jgi:hypothetical protein